MNNEFIGIKVYSQKYFYLEDAIEAEMNIPIISNSD